MTILLETIKEFLLENRVDDVKKKFPNVSHGLIDFFVRNDPSGNQKYLEWMVKAMDHLPTVHSINGEILGYNQKTHGTAFTEPDIETASEILNMVRDFHNLQPYLVHTNEEGKKEGTTDLYRYKFTDGEMIHYLNFDIRQAKERKDKKDKEKELKKGVDKIYEDSNWLVVRPKNWESSCHYGAGTKWCTTSKETSNHFTRETTNKFLIYVINKKLDRNDDTYKVAWQIPYTKRVDTVINPLTFEVSMRGLSLWDAQDNDMTHTHNESGELYLTTVPKSVIKAISDYMKKEMDKMYKNIGFVDNAHIQAIVEFLRLSQNDANEIRLLDETNYGMPVYYYRNEWGGIAYAVATSDEAYEAKIKWATDFIRMNGIEEALEHIDGFDDSEIIYIENQPKMAEELTNNYMEDLDDEQIVSVASDYNTLQPYVDRYKELRSNLLGIKNVISELENRFQNEDLSRDEYQNKIDQLTQTKIRIGQDVRESFLTIIRELKERIYLTYIKEMEHPITWLKNYGWWEDGKPHPEAFERGIISIDEDALINRLTGTIDYDYFSEGEPVEKVNIGGENYYLFKTVII